MFRLSEYYPLLNKEGQFTYLGNATTDELARSLVMYQLFNRTQIHNIWRGCDPHFLENVFGALYHSYDDLDQDGVTFGAVIRNPYPELSVLSDYDRACGNPYPSRHFVYNAGRALTENASTLKLMQDTRDAAQRDMFRANVGVCSVPLVLGMDNYMKLGMADALIFNAVCVVIGGAVVFTGLKEPEILDRLCNVAASQVIEKWTETALECEQWTIALQDRGYGMASDRKRIEDVSVMSRDQIFRFINRSLTSRDTQRGYEIEIMSQDPDIAGIPLYITAEAPDLGDEGGINGDQKKRKLNRPFDPRWSWLRPPLGVLAPV